MYLTGNYARSAEGIMGDGFWNMKRERSYSNEELLVLQLVFFQSIGL